MLSSLRNRLPLMNTEHQATSTYDQVKELEAELDTARLQAEIKKLHEVDTGKKSNSSLLNRTTYVR